MAVVASANESDARLRDERLLPRVFQEDNLALSDYPRSLKLGGGRGGVTRFLLWLVWSPWQPLTPPPHLLGLGGMGVAAAHPRGSPGPSPVSHRERQPSSKVVLVEGSRASQGLAGVPGRWGETRWGVVLRTA